MDAEMIKIRRENNELKQKLDKIEKNSRLSQPSRIPDSNFYTSPHDDSGLPHGAL